MRLVLFFAILMPPIGLPAAPQQPTTSSVTSAAIEIHYIDRHFVPQKIEVPVGKSLTLRVVNESKERIEFESFKLHRERVVEAGETLLVQLPPLKAGVYDFFDDFHEEVPEGRIIAR